MPIITSLLDTDAYKFKMGKLVWRKYPRVPVRYGFTNRTKSVRLPEFVSINDLRDELDGAREISFRNEELDYLGSLKNRENALYDKDYLAFLKDYHLPPYELEETRDSFRLEFPGEWQHTIYWETIALPIITELYTRGLLKTLTDKSQADVFNKGILRLQKKQDVLGKRPDIAVSDFGTRRRASREWQGYVVPTMAHTPNINFLGTSNVYLAMKHGVPPIGTMAHELFMVMAALRMAGTDEELINSQRQVLRDWWEEFGPDHSIALSDTWGRDFFLSKLFPEFARTWQGSRQDSGDPFAYGEALIGFYRLLRIDPRQKLIVFSDGLDLDTIVALADIFAGRIKVGFGWGTNLTNDLGLPTLSLVIKVIEAAGYGTVKLSDNLAKAMGRREDIQRIIRVAGYHGTFQQECRY